VWRFVAGLVLAAPAAALEPGDRVDNFRLVDHAGVSHELYYLSDLHAVVLAAHGTACPRCRRCARRSATPASRGG
jgi:hypothetical protein